MPLPTSSDVHVNVPLTNIAVAFLQDTSQYINMRVFPRVPVAKESNRYFVYAKGDWYRSEARLRAPSASSKAAVLYNAEPR